MPERAAITDANPTVADMEARVARFARLVPTDDYVERRHPRLRPHHLARAGHPAPMHRWRRRAST